MQPFTVDIPTAAIDDLRDRLARTRWPEQFDDAGWDYGINLPYLREICEYWRTGYDWYAAQERLNRHPQFRHEVDGVDLHFLHLRGGGFPLLLLHGWPGSVWEFMDVLEPLRADFDLVVPSLPGFGFSGRPTERGWGVTRIAAAMSTLMRDLGYDRFGAQGGDWGAFISSQLGVDDPEHCVAIHLNMPSARPGENPSPAVAEWVARSRAYREKESAYSMVQATKPDSLTVAQNDSPAGLAAWILEKFHTWTDDASVLDRDDLLTNVMLYWLTGAAPSAARIYYERARDTHAQEFARVRVPTGVAELPAEPFAAPREVSEGRYPIERWTTFPAGGHFAALEQPDALVADVRAFFRGLGMIG